MDAVPALDHEFRQLHDNLFPGLSFLIPLYVEARRAFLRYLFSPGFEKVLHGQLYDWNSNIRRQGIHWPCLLGLSSSHTARLSGQLASMRCSIEYQHGICSPFKGCQGLVARGAGNPSSNIHEVRMRRSREILYVMRPCHCLSICRVEFGLLKIEIANEIA